MDIYVHHMAEAEIRSLRALVALHAVKEQLKVEMQLSPRLGAAKATESLDQAATPSTRKTEWAGW